MLLIPVLQPQSLCFSLALSSLSLEQVKPCLLLVQAAPSGTSNYSVVAKFRKSDGSNCLQAGAI